MSKEKKLISGYEPSLGNSRDKVNHKNTSRSPGLSNQRLLSQLELSLSQIGTATGTTDISALIDTSQALVEALSHSQTPETMIAVAAHLIKKLAIRDSHTSERGGTRYSIRLNLFRQLFRRIDEELQYVTVEKALIIINTFGTWIRERKVEGHYLPPGFADELLMTFLWILHRKPAEYSVVANATLHIIKDDMQLNLHEKIDHSWIRISPASASVSLSAIFHSYKAEWGRENLELAVTCMMDLLILSIEGRCRFGQASEITMNLHNIILSTQMLPPDYQAHLRLHIRNEIDRYLYIARTQHTYPHSRYELELMAQDIQIMERF